MSAEGETILQVPIELAGSRADNEIWYLPVHCFPLTPTFRS